MNKTACAKDFSPVLKASIPLKVKVLIESSHIKNHFMLCQWKIRKYRNHYLSLTVGRLIENESSGNFTLTFKEAAELNAYGQVDPCLTRAAVDSMNLKTAEFSFVSDKSVQVHFESHGWLSAGVVTLYLDLRKGIYVHDLPVDMLSDKLGYVRSPCFGQKYPDNYDGRFDINIASNESLLIRIITLDVLNCGDDYLLFTVVAEKKTHMVCRKPSLPHVAVFRQSLRISFHADHVGGLNGFEIMFAILPQSQEPEQLPSKLFNCSVPGFHSFKRLINCNLMKECESGEDEHDCSYRNNNCGKEETIKVGTKCYSSIREKQNFSWTDAQANCKNSGGDLPTFGSFEEWTLFQKQILPLFNVGLFFIGAQRRQHLQPAPLEAMYKYIWQWVDGRTSFSFRIFGRCRSCARFEIDIEASIQTDCFQLFSMVELLCEFDGLGGSLHYQSLADSGSSLKLHPTGVLWNVSVVQCTSGHMTRDFLYCDIQANCDTQHSTTSCRTGGVTVPMFGCQESRSTVHYTLVCDHMQHCSDNSDEDFCEYPECPSTSVKCHNGQCIHSHQQCDGKLDCYDGSDEGCQTIKPHNNLHVHRPASIFLDGKGRFSFERLGDFDECPSTHFLCPRGFCLPVYLLCNGVVDCVGREDEVGCNRFTCPDFYRCLGSKTCLHPEHVCDGVPQCPKQDDELLCDLTCPDECRCQGLAFVCTSSFSAVSQLTLRYLDVSGSNMTLSEFSGNVHLIALRMSECHITSLPLNMTFPNLRELDLSWNKLHELDMLYFRSLKNLRVLLLLGNPILHVLNSKSSESSIMSLERIDLSHSRLGLFDGRAFANFSNIKVLNMSWSKLQTIAENGFHFMPRLEVIDMRKTPLKHFPRTLLRDLKFLKSVHAENYKLCCKAMLPVSFDLQECHAPVEFLASCEDLLKSNSYRVFLWVFASLSLVGNMFSVGARLYNQKYGSTLGSFGVFVTNLSVADFFMGVYLTVIGAADLSYVGLYLWRDNEWKNSITCNIAGVLCLLSSEVSAFIICIITLDRFLVLRFPFGRFHFRYRSATAACGLVWAVGIVLAMIPLLPLTSHWEFYKQTGICIPLPFTSSATFRGYNYSFGISILLNSILFVLIAVGQIVIYSTVRANSMPSSTNAHARDAAVARRLITVVVSDFLCWFPIGLLGLLASTGTPIPEDLNVAVAIFVFPVNSALNPFLYTFNMFMEKRRKAQYEQLLKRLEEEIRFQPK